MASEPISPPAKRTACDATAARLSENGECISIPADLSNDGRHRALAAEISGREKQLDILVNNAGATWGAPIEEFPESGWDKVMDINVKSPFFLTQALLPLLDEISVAGGSCANHHDRLRRRPQRQQLPTFSYGPSKAAVHHLARTLASHLADRNITVNAIAPGPFPSKMMAHTLETFGEQIRNSVPLKRIGQPADMAGAAIYLVVEGRQLRNRRRHSRRRRNRRRRRNALINTQQSWTSFHITVLHNLRRCFETGFFLIFMVLKYDSVVRNMAQVRLR